MSHPWSDSDSEEDDSFFLLEENLVPLAAVTVTVTDGRFFPFLSRAGVVVAIDPNAPELSAIGLAPLGRVVTTCGPATIVGICASSHLWMQLDRDLEKLRRVSISHFSSVKLTAESLGCEGVVTIDDEDPPELLLAPLLTFGLRLISERAAAICFALQSKSLPALVTQTVIDAACPLAHIVPFHKKWNLVTAVKHFKR